MADNVKFTIDFVANLSKFEKALKRVEALQAKFNKGANKQGQQQYSYDNKSYATSVKTYKIKNREREESLRHENKLKDLQDKRQVQEKRHKLQLDKLDEQAASKRRRELRETQRHGAGGFLRGLVFGGHRQPMDAMRVGQAVRRGGFTLAGGLLGFVFGRAMAAHQRMNEFRSLLAPSIGLPGPKSGAGIAPGKAFRRALRGAPGLGFSPLDTAQQIGVMGPATGVLGPAEMQQAMRASGMDAGGVGEIFRSIRDAGASFAGASKKRASQGADEFKKILAAGVASGLDHSRVGSEFIRGIGAISDQVRGRYAGAFNPSDIARNIAMLGRGGHPGFRGRAGLAVAQNIDEMIRNPGGGEFGRQFMLGTMGYGNPQGGVGILRAERMMERGFFRDPDNLNKFLLGLRGLAPNDPLERQKMGKTLSGGRLSMEQIEKLEQLQDTGKLTKEEITKIETEMKGEKSLREQAYEAMIGVQGGIRDLARQIAQQLREAHTFEPIIQGIYKAQGDFMTKVILPFVNWLKRAWPDIVRGFESVVGAIKELKNAVVGEDVESNDRVSQARKALRSATLRATGQGSLTTAQSKLINQIAEQYSADVPMRNKDVLSFAAPFAGVNQGVIAPPVTKGISGLNAEELERRGGLRSGFMTKEALDFLRQIMINTSPKPPLPQTLNKLGTPINK